MKSLTITTVLLIVFFSISAFADSFNMAAKTNTDDIPFNTKSIKQNIDYNKAVLQEFKIEEEAYIDDMPFNTTLLTEQYFYNKAIIVNFEMEEESFINDMPFNTAQIVKNAK